MGIKKTGKIKTIKSLALLALLPAMLFLAACGLKGGQETRSDSSLPETETLSESTSQKETVKTTKKFFSGFDHKVGEGEIGKTAEIVDISKHSAIKIYYPLTGIKTVDELIEDKAIACAKDFKDEALAGGEKNPAVLKVDYQIFTASKTKDPSRKDYYSLVFKLDIKIPAQDTERKEVRTFIIDAKSGKALAGKDIFRKAYTKRAKSLTTAFFTADEKTKEYAKSQEFKDLLNQEGNLEKLALDGNFVRIYFDPGSLFPAEEGYKRAKVRISNFGGLPKIRVAGFGISEDAKIVALTFDDGPHPKASKDILALLEKHSSRATFFTLGKNARLHGKLLKEISVAGNEIGCHSEGHKNLTKISNDDALRAEALGHVAFIKQLTGQNFVPFCAPYGATNDRVLKVLDVPFFMWSIDPRDWEYKPQTEKEKDRAVAKISAAVLDNVKDGDIILLHDIYDLTARSTAVILPKLKERGFEVVGVGELFDARGVELKGGEKYRKAPPAK